MDEVSLSLTDSVLGEVEKLKSAQKRTDDSLKILNVPLGTLSKATGETQQVCLMSLTL